ncbi:MAG: ABC transporter permease subunit [Nitrospinae bacterium]|nr:ABC transporter permease subunit [Nitrospinota bacterium]
MRKRFLTKLSLEWIFAFFVLYVTPTPAYAGKVLDTVRSGGVLSWGSDAQGGAPYVYPDPDNPSMQIGFEVDLAAAIAGEMGAVARQFQSDWESLIPSLKRGDFHMAMNGIEWTPERAREVDFSIPYYAFSLQLAGRAGDRTMGSLDDTKGKRVGTLGGSVAHRFLESMPAVDLKIYTGQVEPYRDLELGRLDAVLMDLPIAVFYAKSNPRLKFAGPPAAGGVYAIATPKGDVDFLREVDRILGGLYRSGKLKAIYERWGLWDENQERLARTALQKPGGSPAPPPPGNGLGAYVPLLLKGAGMTVLISVTAMAVAIALGLAVALLRIAGGRFLKPLAVAYIEIVRGTPLLLQLYIVYYGLPNIGVSLNAFMAAVLALGVNYSAYEAEVYRAGLAAIPKGQTEAGFSLGMTLPMIYRRILIPQAVKIVLPPATNDFISLFKDSSLVSIIAIVELTKTYNILAVSSLRYLELGALTAALYLSMSLPLAYLTSKLERKFHAV